MASKYQKKKPAKPNFDHMNAESAKQRGKGVDKSTGEQNSLFREGEIAIARHEELTGVNRADWDLIMAAQIKACEVITSTRDNGS